MPDAFDWLFEDVARRAAARMQDTMGAVVTEGDVYREALELIAASWPHKKSGRIAADALEVGAAIIASTAEEA